MTSIHPVILSGGAGKRLWPASRQEFPKPLLELAGQGTMLQQTALRVAERPLFSPQLTVVCNDDHRFLVAEQLADVDASATIILEPVGRNTAPAAALAALHAMAQPGTAAPMMLLMPADHLIRDGDAFRAAIVTAAAAAERGRIVCFGIVPTRAATDYGYIEAGPRSANVAPIRSFVEKPDRPTAERLLRSESFLWNAGIFLVRADVYLSELGKYAPDILEACRASMSDARTEGDYVRPNAERFGGSPADSIDYAVMEHTDLGDVVPLSAGWSDIGSWQAIHEVSRKDAGGNALSGDVAVVDCENSLLQSSSRLVTAVGLRDVVIVEDADAVLVTSMDRSQDVKALVEGMDARSRRECVSHRRETRPWGSFDRLQEGPGFQVKRLSIKPQGALSLQKHRHRSEHWVVVSGRVRVTLDRGTFELGPNESTYIPVGALHRIENPWQEPAVVVEVQCGERLDEDDIERVEDAYGRAAKSVCDDAAE